ncbi:PVC-type heme-binding CxxCH protein [Planctellipticum variicoloris]|uniref:PVC-type heme-binding CxxCH protein n=1 Tax=Planctellipticum variicoloris TaxID=3064265 RepID=UPI0030136AFA|nr:c-type cytochrome [Planctomycetaceae bacterium SH412]
MPAVRTVRLTLLYSGVFLSTLASQLSTLPAASPQVPDGFTIEKVAGFPLLQRPIFAGFDDQGVLYVGESNGENLKRDDMLAKKPHWISRLEDADGDGTFDKSTKFVENITLPQGCLWYRGSLYAACPPSIWKFTDTDNDGVADQREEILTGFGFSGNACDTHGPFLSPTGRLYIVQGRHGHEFKDKEGKVYSKGKAGRIYSCKTDGSDVRVHAGGGFDNPVEVDFTEEGECIGTVNILYRDRGDCLMHWVEGGVYPREDQADCVAEFKWTGGLLGPIHNLGHVACSGIMRYRGTHFGEGFKDRWFFTEFNTHKMRYAELKRAGSTFTAEIHDFLQCDDGDFHPTDVLEDADGSLLVLNTGAWFLNGCPTSRVSKPEIHGGVYRIRKKDGAKVSDPWGKKADWSLFPVQNWMELARDSRPAVRERAIEEFCAKILSADAPVNGDSPSIRWFEEFEKLDDKRFFDPDVTRALVCAASRDTQATAFFLGTFPLDSEGRNFDAISRKLALRCVYEHSMPYSLQPILFQLSSPDLSVRRMAVEALGCRILQGAGKKLQNSGEASLEAVGDGLINGAAPNSSVIIPKLADAMKKPDVDRFFEHSVVHALINLNDAVTTQGLLSSDSPAVQRVALIALDQMNDSPLTREMVLPLLASDDPKLQQTALEVIARRPGWAKETLELLKSWVAEPELSADRANALRGFLLAQLGDKDVQAFVTATLQDRQSSVAACVLFWEILQRSTLAQWPAGWQPLLVEALGSSDENIVLPALRIITQRSLPGFETALQRIAGDGQRSLTVRSEAVTALGTQSTPLDDGVFGALVAALVAPERSSDEKATLGRALGNGPLNDDQLLKLTRSLDAAGPLVAPVMLKAWGRSTSPAVGQALIAALLKSEAATSISADELAGILRKYPESIRTAAQPLFKKLGVDPAVQEARLAELAPLLEAGNAAAGKAVFFGRKAACASCHAVAGEGGRVGPHLTTIGASRSAKDLLEAIVYPSASFVNGYRAYVVVMDSGKVHQGVISAETTDTITLRTQDLQELRLRRDEVEELKESSTSIMPKGLDTQLSAEELQNLLAYLRGLK